MRQDQFEGLQSRLEQLVDVFLTESNPDKWPGAGLDPVAMDKQTRGDRYWSKKDAVATIACVQRISTLVHTIQTRSYDVTSETTEGSDDDADLGKEIAAAEAEADRLTDMVLRAARKDKFDKNVHGKKG